MKLITIDFETYYDKEFSLTKVTTEEYVRSLQFETIGVSVKVNSGTPQWFSGDLAETTAWLKQFDWENSAALAHNAMFDGAILNWIYGIRPRFWFDTLCMGRLRDLLCMPRQVVTAPGLRRILNTRHHVLAWPPSA